MCYDNICLIIGCSLYRNPGLLLLPLPLLYHSHYLPFISPTLEIFLPHTKLFFPSFPVSPIPIILTALRLFNNSKFNLSLEELGTQLCGEVQKIRTSVYVVIGSNEE